MYTIEKIGYFKVQTNQLERNKQMSQKTKTRSLEQVLSEERKLSLQEEKLAADRRELNKREEQFFSSFEQSLTNVQTILDNYVASSSARAFYYDFLDQLYITKRKMSVAFDDERNTIMIDLKKLEVTKRSLYEEKLAIQHQENTNKAKAKQSK